ncbi:hypothetical protein LTR94_036270, partial [Friedmanniomyces endolithicus]
RSPPRPGDAEVEPLIEVGLVIGDDLEVDYVALDGDDADIAAVERGVDGDAHFTVVVIPDSPGKLRNMALARRSA